MALGWEMVGRGPKPRFHRTMRPLPKAKPTRGSNGDAFTRSDLTLIALPRHPQRDELAEQNPNGQLGLGWLWDGR